MRLAPKIDEELTWRSERWHVVATAAVAFRGILAAAGGQTVVFAGLWLWLISLTLLVNAAATVVLFRLALPRWTCANCGTPWRQGDKEWASIGPPWKGFCRACVDAGALAAAWKEDTP